jgi:hypothetical protein
MANIPPQNTPTTNFTVEKRTTTAPQIKSNKKKAIPWDRDGVNGGSSSVEIVLEWLTTGSNHQQWRGDLEEGKNKKSLCSEILELMKENGLHHRDAKGKSLRPKIMFLAAYFISILPPRHNPTNRRSSNLLKHGTGLEKEHRRWDS